jgi:hypothetical protein
MDAEPRVGANGRVAAEPRIEPACA